MGYVYETVNAQGLIRAYNEGAVTVTDALITPGNESVEVNVESLSEDEVTKLALKLDVLASALQNEPIARMVAKAFPHIVTLVGWVKKEAPQRFEGIKALGKQLDIVWMRPQDVGSAVMSTAGTGSTGLYGGTGDAVFTWLQTFVAGTSDDIIPEQIMKDEAGCIHMGMIETVPLPSPVNRIKFTLSGVASPPQSIPLSHVDGSELAFQEFEMPVVVGPKLSQKIEFDTGISKDGRPELLSFLVLQADEIGF